mmetsp:Transcript_37137/g.86610  ORF Transcript_37137/g.86610 Transcript_37137/m.86610 type:complete len:535 (-) Transcript_37137:46-1650(-)
MVSVKRHEQKSQNVVSMIKNAATKADTLTALKLAKSTFNHNNKEKHDVEINAGAATALYKLLSITIHMNGAVNNVATACSALELVLGCSTESKLDTYEIIGERLLSLLVIVIQRCLQGMLKNNGSILVDAIRIIRYFSQLEEVKISIAKQRDVLPTLVDIIDKCERYDARVEAMHAIISLSFELKNAIYMCNCEGFLKLFTKISLDFEESPQMKQWVAVTFWNLGCEPVCREGLCSRVDVLDAIKHLMRFKNSKTKEYAISALRQLSLETSNRIRLVEHSDGLLFRQIVDIVTEERVADTIVLKALETLNNIIASETGGIACANSPLSENNPGLIVTLTSVVTDNNVPKLRMIALSILIKLCHNLKNQAMLKVGDTELVALVACLVTIAKTNRNEYRSNVFMALKTLSEEKSMRQPMAECPGLLDVVSWTFNSDSANRNDIIDAMIILSHLAEEEENRISLASNDIFLRVLANLLSSHDAILKQHAEDIVLCLALTPASQHLVARNKFLLSAILQSSKETDKMTTAFKTLSQFM